MVEALPHHAHDEEVLGGQAAESTAQRHGVRQPEAVARGGSPRFRLGLGLGVHEEHRARGPVAAHGVDDDCDPRAGPRVEQPAGLTVEEHDLDVVVSRRRKSGSDTVGHNVSDTVVTSPRVAQADDDRGTVAAGHLRTTVRSRKWVAHEMHGSWLRMTSSAPWASS